MLVSIIIPTLNEAESLKMLIPTLKEVLSKIACKSEIIIVDDNSKDSSYIIFNEITRDPAINVHIRKWKKGLSSAIVDGFCLAKGDIFVVLDADLSHEIQAVPRLINTILHEGYQFAIGSRYIKNGEIVNWPFRRRFLSVAAKLLACFLSDVKDPLSGFFAITRELLDDVRLNTTGFKICLEILVKTKCRSIKEVPYKFTDRKFGRSKVDSMAIMGYLVQLLDLYNFRYRQCSKK